MRFDPDHLKLTQFICALADEYGAQRRLTYSRVWLRVMSGQIPSHMHNGSRRLSVTDTHAAAWALGLVVARDTPPPSAAA